MSTPESTMRILYPLFIRRLVLWSSSFRGSCCHLWTTNFVFLPTVSVRLFIFLFCNFFVRFVRKKLAGSKWFFGPCNAWWYIILCCKQVVNDILAQQIFIYACDMNVTGWIVISVIYLNNNESPVIESFVWTFEYHINMQEGIFHWTFFNWINI